MQRRTNATIDNIASSLLASMVQVKSTAVQPLRSGAVGGGHVSDQSGSGPGAEQRRIRNVCAFLFGFHFSRRLAQRSAFGNLYRLWRGPLPSALFGLCVADMAQQRLAQSGHEPAAAAGVARAGVEF